MIKSVVANTAYYICIMLYFKAFIALGLGFRILEDYLVEIYTYVVMYVATVYGNMYYILPHVRTISF